MWFQRCYHLNFKAANGFCMNATSEEKFFLETHSWCLWLLLLFFLPSVSGAHLNQTGCRTEQIYAGKSGWGHKQYSALPNAWRGGGRLCQAWRHGKDHAGLWDGADWGVTLLCAALSWPRKSGRACVPSLSGCCSFELGWSHYLLRTSPPKDLGLA